MIAAFPLRRFPTVLILAISFSAFAADGTIDTSFGNGGLALTGLTDAYSGESAPAVQPDGKILICGQHTSNGSSGSDFFAARFTSDGKLDTSFSFDGRVTIDFDGVKGFDLLFGIAS